jgi:hypothetical protein
MRQDVTLSTLIDANVKKAVIQLCKRHGLKLRSLIEQALIDQLEDEMDLQAYHQRRSEETIPLEEILKGQKKRRG